MVYLTYAHQPEVAALTGLIGKNEARYKLVRARGSEAGAHLTAALRADGGTRPDLVLNIGFAGTLRPGLEPGEVVFVSESAGPINSGAVNSGTVTELFPVEFGNCHRINLKKAYPAVRCVTSERPITCERDRVRLRGSTGADIVDMEAAYLCAAARAHNIPFAAIKVISDRANDSSRADAIGQAAKWSKILANAVLGLEAESF